MSAPLFDGFDTPQEPAPKPTAGERRRTRHEALIASGLHPLSSYTPRKALKLLDDDLTCGDCAHRRQVKGGTARNYPKCTADHGRRATHGDGTDCRAWWPACVDFQPTEEAPR